MNETGSASPPIEPRIGMVHTMGGQRLDDAAPCDATEARSLRAARARTGERLFTLIDLSGPASPRLYRELCEQIARTYWASTGSITAALRKAAAAANRHLFQRNLHSVPAERCEGGLICALVRGEDLFILQAGPGQAHLLHRDHIQPLTSDEHLPPLGLGPLADVRLHHTFIALGDTMLLASAALMQEVDTAGLTRVLLRPDVDTVLEGLEQIAAGTDFAAQVVRWTPPEEAPAAPEIRRPTPRPARTAPPPSSRPSTSPVPTAPSPRPSTSPVPTARPSPRPSTRHAPTVEARSPRPPSPRLSLRPLGKRVQRGIAALGRGIATTGASLATGASGFFQRMLPGRERGPQRRTQPSRPVPDENRTIMTTIAIGIPVLLAIVVALAYYSFGLDARVRDLTSQAQDEIALAETAGGTSEEARPHWEAALIHAKAALALRPRDTTAAELTIQAQQTLDHLDGVTRLDPVRLWDFGPSTAPRQLAIHGHTVFVLDPAKGWVARLTLNPTADGVIEQGDAPTLVESGQQVPTTPPRPASDTAGDLVDLVWIGLGADRQTSGLVILEQGGVLISHDPAWIDDAATSSGGAESPRLSRSLLGTTPSAPQSVGAFRGRFYVLDTQANQVWRYEPQGNTYPGEPDAYFATSPPKSLAGALDMAIDGYIYILYQDGQLLQFLQGEQQPSFSVHDVPGEGWQAAALAVDPEGSGNTIYVADRGNKRIIVLGPDGGFQAQLRADEAFDELETLAIDEAAGRLYILSGGKLYVASY